MAEFIKNWEELAKVPDSETHTLTFEEVNGRKCAGWIKQKGTGKIERYLSTHTFYGNEYKTNTKLLQSYGFDVELANWDNKQD